MIKLLRKLKAKFRGSFVTDCPHCHKHFYGWENHQQHIKIGNKNYRIVCHRCANLIKKLPVQG